MLILLRERLGGSDEHLKGRQISETVVAPNSVAWSMGFATAPRSILSDKNCPRLQTDTPERNDEEAKRRLLSPPGGPDDPTPRTVGSSEETGCYLL